MTCSAVTCCTDAVHVLYMCSDVLCCAVQYCPILYQSCFVLSFLISDIASVSLRLILFHFISLPFHSLFVFLFSFPFFFCLLFCFLFLSFTCFALSLPFLDFCLSLLPLLCFRSLSQVFFLFVFLLFYPITSFPFTLPFSIFSCICLAFLFLSDFVLPSNLSDLILS